MKFNIKLERVNYIKIFLNDEQDDSSVIKCGIRKIENKEIIAFTKSNDNLKELVQKPVKVIFVCDDGVYSVKTRVKKIEKAEPYLILIIEEPEEMDFEQKREFFRVQTSIDCVCETSVEGYGAKYLGKILNLSANGVSVLFENYFIVNKTCEISFTLENKRFTLNASYVRSENYEGGYKIAFSFMKVSESDKDFISRVCLQKQLENKRKNLM